MRAIKAFCVFIGVFLAYHVLFGCNVFPVDENNVLQAPVWYPIIGFLLSAGAAYLSYRPRRIKNHVYNSNASAESDTDIATRIIIETGQASISIIERRTGRNYKRAAQAMAELETAGIVGPAIGSAPRQILLGTSQTLQQKEPSSSTVAVCGLIEADSKDKKVLETDARTNGFQEELGRSTLAVAQSWPSYVDFEQIVRDEHEWRRQQCGLSPIDYELELVDSMDGYAFEHWCANLLSASGYMNLEVTPGSNDQGVDIIAEKDGMRYAFQCKCYSSNLGNKPVQEVNTGRAVYHCHMGVVITNRYFTSGAKEASEATGVLLWDRDKLIEMLEQAH